VAYRERKERSFDHTNKSFGYAITLSNRPGLVVGDTPFPRHFNVSARNCDTEDNESSCAEASLIREAIEHIELKIFVGLYTIIRR